MRERFIDTDASVRVLTEILERLIEELSLVGGRSEESPRLLMHIPHPRLHTVRYYGESSSVVRARRRAEAEGMEAGVTEPIRIVLSKHVV